MSLSRMVRMPDGGVLRLCPLRGNAPNVFGISKGIGRSVLLVVIGVPMPNLTPGPFNQSLWCEICQRYFNPKVPHACQDQAIQANRAQLEKWLGTYTIQEG